MNPSRNWIRMALAVIGVVYAAAATAQPAIAELLAKMPAPSVEEGFRIQAELVRLGAPGVTELCAMLVPPGTGDDTNARYALSGLSKYVSHAGAEADRAMFEGAVLAVLEAPGDAEVKAFLIEQLKLTASDAAVPVLSGFLADERLCEPAVQTLLNLGTPKAAEALAKALPEAKGAHAVTLVKALGELRYAPAKDAITGYAKNEEVTTRLEALFALAKIGDPDSEGVLAQGAEAKAAYERGQAIAAYLHYAERRAESGDAKTCEDICRKLMAAPAAPETSNVPCAALSLLASVKGKNILPELLSAMDSDNAALRGIALQLSKAIPGASESRKWAKKAAKAAPETRVAILAMLGEREDKSATKALIHALKDKDKAVRMAAAAAVTRYGKEKALNPLIEAIERAQDPDEITCLKEALLRVPGEAVAAEAADTVGEVSGAARVAMLEILAARRADAYVDTVFAETASEDPQVKLAAITALGMTGTGKDLPRAIPLLLNAAEGEQKAAHQTVVALAGQLSPAKARVVGVLKALPDTPAGKKETLLRVLPDLNDKEALAAVANETGNANAATAQAALQVLANWPRAEAAEPLLDYFASSKDAAQRETALAGCLRLAASNKLPDEDRLWVHAHALQNVSSAAEKKAVLAGLSEIRNLTSLQLVADCLEDPDVKVEAAAAAAKIACSRGKDDTGLDGSEVAQILDKAARGASAEDRKRIEEHIATMPLPEELNLARGKPVRASVAAQGDHAPEKAVDGNLDKEAAWFGDGTPAALDVDLGAAMVIDRAQIYLYWDGARYYQYKLEVSPNGNRWQTVADRSGNTTPATPRGTMLSFAPIKARYVRVNVLKCSENPAAHIVELRVYAQGASLPVTPPAAAAPPAKEGFVSLFNGKDLSGWAGDTRGYEPQFGKLVCLETSHMNLFTEKDYANFVFRFEFKLTPGANNGIGIRTPFRGHAAYDGMEIQIQDDVAEVNQGQQPYQTHGSIYGVVPAKREGMKPAGEWNSEEIIAKGHRIMVILNGVTILDTDLDEVVKQPMPDNKKHPGLLNDTGRIVLLGHGTRVEFRNLRIKELP